MQLSFDNFKLADEPFAKSLRTFETYELFNYNLCGELFSSLESPATSDESLSITSVSFFISDFNLLDCELDKFTFTVLY